MKKIIREAMMEEMESSGFRLIRENGDTWVKLLDQNKVVHIYHMQFVPWRRETTIDFILYPIIFPYWCGWRDYKGGIHLSNIDCYCYDNDAAQEMRYDERERQKLFYKMHNAQSEQELNQFKEEYSEMLRYIYVHRAKPFFAQSCNMSTCIDTCEEIEDRQRQVLYDAGELAYNMYYVDNYLYKCIYDGNIDDYIRHLEEYNRLYFDYYGREYTFYANHESLTRYKARDAEYFMNKYKKVQEENAEEAARLLGMDKEAFPYVPPLKELKL